MKLKWPKYLRDNITRAGTALINKYQSYIDILQIDIDMLYDLNDPYRCPEKFLSVLSNDLHGEFNNDDTVREKRIKLATAIQRGKDKSLWETDLKLRVKSVLGYSVDLYSRRSSTTLYDSIFWGGTDDRDRNWCIAESTGQAEIFVGGIVGIPYTDDFLHGIICIDVKSSQSAATLQKIVLEINREGGYVGHRIFIGYLSGTIYTVEAEA
jgi:hypothetical protein